MRPSLSSIALLLFASAGHAADYQITFSAVPRVLPSPKALVVVKAGEPGPGSAKFKAVAETAKFNELIKLPSEGPFDIWWLPKESMSVRITSNVTLKDGTPRDIKVTDFLGVVSFRGDGQPRAALVTIAAQDDPGPDEKGHRPVQTAKDYRIDMVVPEGFYSLWVTPENGARPRKVNERFRVQAGKTVVLD